MEFVKLPKHRTRLIDASAKSVDSGQIKECGRPGMRRLGSEFGGHGRLVKSAQRDQRPGAHAQNASRKRAVRAEALGLIQGLEPGIEAATDDEHVSQRVMRHPIIRIEVDALFREAYRSVMIALKRAHPGMDAVAEGVAAIQLRGLARELAGQGQ